MFVATQNIQRRTFMPSGMRHYPSDLTDAQWESIRHLLPKAKKGGRPRTTNIRTVIDAIFYVSRTGCAWRYLPECFPPWQTVHRYFTLWQVLGVWKRVHDCLVRRLRKSISRNVHPSCGIVDSQSVKAPYGKDRGYDGFKRLQGRKRQLLVDTFGFIHSIRVHGANKADSKEGALLFETCKSKFLKNLSVIYADLGYRGYFVEQTKLILGFRPTLPEPARVGGVRLKVRERTKRELKGLTKNRWIVERTFAWFNNYRRLTRDYERTTQNSTAMIYLSMTQLLFQRWDKKCR